jgi:hypothetical protein
VIILPLLPGDGTALDLLTDLAVKRPYIQLKVRTKERVMDSCGKEMSSSPAPAAVGPLPPGIARWPAVASRRAACDLPGSCGNQRSARLENVGRIAPA